MFNVNNQKVMKNLVRKLLKRTSESTVLDLTAHGNAIGILVFHFCMFVIEKEATRVSYV